LSALTFRLASSLRLDYDEVAEFHAIWQVSQGHKPYVDFCFEHPPYFWLLYSPILRRLPQTFESLLVLRRLNLGFSFLALALLIFMLLRRNPDRSWRTCALASVGLVALQVPVVFTFAQFRADHLVLALTLAGLLILEHPGSSPAPPMRWALSGLLFTAAALLSPKLALIYGAAILLYGYERWTIGQREGPCCLFAFLLGSAGAFLALNAATLMAGVNPWPYFQWVVKFYFLTTTHSGYRFGLARGLLLRTAYNPLLLLIILGGTAAAVQELWKNGWRKNKILIVFLGFALVQPLWVKYFYDQYLYTVLLAWTLPLALFFHGIGRWKSRLAQLAVALLFWGGVYIALPELATYGHDRRGLDDEIALGDKLLELAPIGSPVSMQPPTHVVFRENSTYFFTYTQTPAGPDTEAIMLDSPQLKGFFSFPGYVDQLERRPPSLILVNPAFSGRQYRQAIDYFIHTLHPRDYEERRILDARVFVRKPGPRTHGP